MCMRLGVRVLQAPETRGVGSFLIVLKHAGVVAVVVFCSRSGLILSAIKTLFSSLSLLVGTAVLCLIHRPLHVSRMAPAPICATLGGCINHA